MLILQGANSSQLNDINTLLPAFVTKANGCIVYAADMATYLKMMVEA